MSPTMSDHSDAKLAVFSPERFLVDVRKLASALNAPYSESAIRAVLKAYHQNFIDGAILWRTTDRPGDKLNFRFFSRGRVDCIAIAVGIGFIDANNPLGRMITSWSALYDGTPTQSCDFDAQTGLVKTWVYLGWRPLEDILLAPEVPETFRGLGPMFQELGLKTVGHVAVDYHSNTVNLYFRPPGPITEEQAAKLVGLAGSPPPSKDEMQWMRAMLEPKVFAFATTIDVATGAIKRVAFYTFKVPPGEYTELGERVAKFFKYAPSTDDEKTKLLAWSYGNGGKKYVKIEQSYSGQLLQVLNSWKRPLVECVHSSPLSFSSAFTRPEN